MSIVCLYFTSSPSAYSNITYRRKVDDTTLMTESEEELKRLLMRVKEESERASLKLNIKKTKIMASGLITSGKLKGKRWKW